MAKLIIKVVDIKGECDVHSLGDRIIIDGPEIDLKKTNKICIHALAPILHYAVALREEVAPEKLGLTKKGNKAYIRCPDPGEPFTSGGEVVFEVIRVED
jgi:uncharacterized repeat protein (TIGR04076 family)